MELKVKELTPVFGVPANTLYAWIRHREMPGCRIGDQYWFNRAEVLDWAIAHGIKLYHPLYPGSGLSLRQAFAAGRQIRVPGGREAYAHWAALLESSVSRENAFMVRPPFAQSMTHNLPGGIALPSAFFPCPGEISHPSLLLFSFQEPLTAEEFTQKPLHSWFWIRSGTVDAHRSLLERLYQALQDPLFFKAVIQGQTWEELSLLAEVWESGLETALYEYRSASLA